MTPVQAPERVLIVRLSSIGDVVHTLPAFLELRRHWPDTQLGWAVEPAAAPILKHLPGPTKTHVLDLQEWRRTPWRRSVISGARAAVATLRAEEYELAIDFQGLVKSAVVAWLSGAPVLGHATVDLREGAARLLYQRTATALGSPVHAVRRGLHLIPAITGKQAEQPQAEFPNLVTNDERALVDSYLVKEGVGPFAVLHSASNWPSKYWQPTRYTEVAGQLHERTGLEVLWIWGPGEQSMTAALVQSCDRGSRLAFQTDLTQLTALLERARLFIGGDSAPLHLAVASGTPAVALFGPTDPVRNGPLDPNDGIIVNRLPCSHCYRRKCPFGTIQCLEEITVEMVVAEAIARLERARFRVENPT